jgi:eukaryotic-like serine/threonine-protein kinase
MSKAGPELSLPSSPSFSGQERLESWKGIAVYLDRDVRTVQRWEKQEGLPVHRHIHNKLSTVYAFKAELDNWWHERGIKLEIDPTPSDDGVGQRRPQVRRLERIGFVLALVLALGVILTMWLLWPRETAQLPLRRFAFVPREPVSRAVISPNGKHIAYVSESGQQSKLWIQDLDQVEPRTISETGNALDPFWSSDSQFIGYGTKTQLRSVPVIRGDPVTICQLPERGELYLGGTWSPNGDSIVFTQGRKFFEVPARGGKPKILVEIPHSSNVEHVEQPHFLPVAGKKILFTFKEVGKQHAIGLLSAETGKREAIFPVGPGYMFPFYAESGHLLFASKSEDLTYTFLGAMRFSLANLRGTGEVFPIMTNTLAPSVSRDGTLVYVENSANLAPQQVVWRDRKGRKLEVVNQVPVGTMAFSLSRDERKLAVKSWRTSQVLIQDLTDKRESFITSAPEQLAVLWTPDGKALTFASSRGGNYDILLQRASGTGEQAILAATASDEFPSDWSADGRFLVYSVDNPETLWDVWYLERKENGGGYESRAFLQTNHRERNAKFSPDGRFLAYCSDEFGKIEVFIVRFPEGTGKLRVSRSGGEAPRWSRDGRELFYIEGRTLVAVPVATNPDLSLGSARRLFEDPSLQDPLSYAPFEVSQDRQRFLMLEPTGDVPAPVIRVVQNWYSELRKGDR